MCGYHIRICQHNMMAANMFTINCECYISLTIYSTLCCLTPGILKHEQTTSRPDQAGPSAIRTGCSYLKTDTRPSDLCPSHPSLHAATKHPRRRVSVVWGQLWISVKWLSGFPPLCPGVKGWGWEHCLSHTRGWSHYPLFVTGAGITQYLPCGSRVRGGVTW